jgi:hypothetical protein
MAAAPTHLLKIYQDLHIALGYQAGRADILGDPIGTITNSKKEISTDPILRPGNSAYPLCQWGRDRPSDGAEPAKQRGCVRR